MRPNYAVVLGVDTDASSHRLVRVSAFVVTLYSADASCGPTNNCSSTPDPMLCYIGPGGALSALGSLLALVAAVFLALVGFVWYPIKRMLRSKRKSAEIATEHARASTDSLERSGARGDKVET